MHIFRWMIWITVPIFIAVMTFLLVAALRKRAPHLMSAGSNENADDKIMQAALIIWIAVIVGGLVVLTLRSYFVDRALAQTPSEKPLLIEVIAWQWWWQVKYIGSDPTQQFETANELHLPVNRPISIKLESRDVIHSLWLPNLTGKQDLIPGRTNHLNITPTRIGIYRGQCAEFCGQQHAHMAIDVSVESDADFERWREHQLQSAPTPDTELKRSGLAYFQQRECALCHQIDGTDASGKQGPNLTHVASRSSLAAGALPNNSENMARWLRDPQGLKPGNNMPTIGLSDAETAALVAYLETLR